ncbi:MAG: hypothetical protein JO007_01605 [Alphaproteobacteria bacterium]|nr:hypothetical protein [Alphaproteobacteria bacterium]
MKLAEAGGMTYPRKLVEHIILGLPNPLNRHLVKLVGFEFPPETRQHFRCEVRTWLNELEALRLKPNSRPGSFKLYYDLLFDYPFGGVEVQNMRMIMELIADEYEMCSRSNDPRKWSNGCGIFIRSWRNGCKRRDSARSGAEMRPITASAPAQRAIIR